MEFGSADVTVQQSLGVGTYGERFIVRNGQGQTRGLLKLDASLAAHRELVTSLLKYNAPLACCAHGHMVGQYAVVKVGKDLLVYTDELRSASNLEQFLQTNQQVSTSPASASVLAISRTLACGHELGVVHGGLHLRSVFFDSKIGLRVGDYGLGNALAEAAVESDDAWLLRLLSGTMAPELALGGKPSPQSDVFSLGKIAEVLLLMQKATILHESQRKSLREVLSIATAQKPGQRYSDAGKFLQAFAAWAQGVDVASDEDLKKLAKQQSTPPAEAPSGTTPGYSPRVVANTGLASRQREARPSNEVEDTLVSAVPPPGSIKITRKPRSGSLSEDEGTPLPPPMALHDVTGEVSSEKFFGLKPPEHEWPEIPSDGGTAPSEITHDTLISQAPVMDAGESTRRTTPLERADSMARTAVRVQVSLPDDSDDTAQAPTRILPNPNHGLQGEKEGESSVWLWVLFAGVAIALGSLATVLLR